MTIIFINRFFHPDQSATSQMLSDLAFATGDSAKHLSDITLTRANGAAISGTFILTSYQETGQYEDAVTFTATLVRSGIHTWTPAV